VTGSWHPELWLAVIALGAYHGFNPGMGWPLAVSNGMWAKRDAAVFTTLVPLAAGHFLAMAAVILPFSILVQYLDWNVTIRLSAGLVVVAFGLYRFVNRRHPRLLNRVRPSQLTLWSFLMATAHGAGLMLVPIYLGLCTAGHGQAAMADLMGSGLATSVVVCAVHTLAMVVAGGIMAWAVYRYFGLQLLRRAWLNLDSVWAASLVLTGAIGCGMALAAA
jgi:hypothetical protein